MKTLELKHIAPYLPFGLQYINTLRNEINSLTIYQYPKFVQVNKSKNAITLNSYKPILRPLSDLTKEIEIEGIKFVPIDISEIKLHTYNKLLEWHFDVFGLIEQGLAVDINTLNK